VNLLLTRTFFSLQRPWVPTALAVGNMVLNAAVSVALYKPFGIPGLVFGTVVGNVAMTIGQTWRLRDLLEGSLEGRRTLAVVLQMLAASTLLGLVAFGVWWGLDEALGRSLPAQIVSVGAALAASVGVYVAAVLAMGIPEARQIQALIAGRFKRGGS
jgi:putative peptidoglycan lipid II flippase